MQQISDSQTLRQMSKLHFPQSFLSFVSFHAQLRPPFEHFNAYLTFQIRQ